MQQRYKVIFLIVSLVISLIFVVSAGTIYPSLYMGAPDAEGNLDFFRQEMIDTGLTSPMALVTIGLSWIMAALFYYVVNSVHFDRWWHWLVTMVFTALLTSCIDWAVSVRYIARESEELIDIYSPYLLSLSGWNILLGAAFFTIVSYGIRWWSSNCRHTPLPQ